MTEQEFQKTMLNSFQTMEGNVMEFQKTMMNSLREVGNNIFGLKSEVSFLKNQVATLEVFGEDQMQKWKKQEQFNDKLLDRVTTLEVFTEDQFAEQRVFEEKLAVVIENQIVDRISAENDMFKCYTDKKVKRHEVKFRHKIAV